MSPPASTLVRPATPRDGEVLGRMGASLARLHHQLDSLRFMLPEGVEAGYRSWLTRELKDRAAVVLVAELDGLVRGYAYGRLEGRNWNDLLDEHGGFHDLWVDEPARRHGLGRALAEAMVKALLERGAPRVVLKTATANTLAQRLFEGLGFRPTMLEMTRDG